MRAFSKTLLVAAAVVAATPVMAAPARKPAAAGAVSPVTADVRCLMTMIAFGQDKSRAQAGQIGAYFFSGRISARAPGFDLASAMKAQAPTLGPAQLQAELKRCGPMVAAASHSLQGAINSLRPPGSTPAAAPPPANPAPAPAAPVAPK